jgi:hypothetical protein
MNLPGDQANRIQWPELYALFGTEVKSKVPRQYHYHIILVKIKPLSANNDTNIFAEVKRCLTDNLSGIGVI